MKGNKYYDEEDLYDDDYYDDEYYEEASTKQVQKNNQNKSNTSNKLNANQKTTNKQPETKKKAGNDTTKTNAKKNEKAVGAPKGICVDPKVEISLDTAEKKLDKLQIKGDKTFKSNDKEKSAEELNSIKYQKIVYNIDSTLEKPNLSIVIIGHVDSGKSTLMGHLLYLLGEISDKTLQKYEKESKKIGKNTFHFAWALDESTEERNRGITVDIAYKYFETSKKKITAMDAPGHRDFIPNMITGTSAADAAILVIDSNKNAFEAGFFLGGQTKEHAVLARSLGVKQIIVCVNKLELMDWSNERFQYIEAQVRDYLNSLDYKDEDIFMVPVSGLKGTNLLEVDKSITQLGWYEGRSLIEIVDLLNDPVRDLDSPVRFLISDTGHTTINSLQGPGVFGKLESGVIIEDNEYVIIPLNLKVKIRSLTADNVKCSFVKAGQSGELLLTTDKVIAEDIRPGMVLCSVDYPVPVVSQIRAQIITLDINAPLSNGQILFVHCQSQKTQGKIKKIEKIFSKDGKVTKNNTVFIPKNYNAYIILEFEEKLCLELYSNIKALARITLRGSGETLAAGIVLEYI